MSSNNNNNNNNNTAAGGRLYIIWMFRDVDLDEVGGEMNEMT